MSVFIVQSLGNIIFVSALVGVLYYLGVIGFIVKWIGIGRLSCAGNPDGVLAYRKRAGSDWQHYDIEDHLSADRDDKVDYGC